MLNIKPIKCLGMSFENEAARRSYFLEQLANKLQDSEFRKIAGFPNASDEEILALSDPPYYTACPNPWLSDFVEQNLTDNNYQREAFASDVTEAKNDSIYNAHSYHSKLPYKAIMRYILHYTEPGDIVFDGFCGSGMTGVAAQLCARRAILNDLSPAATFITYNYNTPINILTFEKHVKAIIQKIKAEYGWMYQTRHNNILGEINNVVWSDVFICPYCTTEIVFWNVALDKGKTKFPCPHCEAELIKSHLDRALITRFDAAIGKTIKQAKQIPVLINYNVGNKRYQKIPDQYDLELLEKIENMEIQYWFPITELPEAYKTSHGISHIHHFYTKRNLYNLAYLNSILENRTKFILTAILNRSSKMNRRLYIPSLPIETSIIKQLETRLKRIKTAFESLNHSCHFNNIISTGCSSSVAIKDESIDYIFLDSPFGLNYSKLNLLWEAWLKVFTNNVEEEYNSLMQACFQEAYRILKPGRWMTVVFSKSLKTNIEQAGFIIANIATLNKKLIISARKPNQQNSQQLELIISDEANAIKQFRIEALQADFKQAWKKQDYQTIISIAEKIPKMVLYEDEQLLQFYELAKCKFQFTK
jgi:DNA modification methylase/predicted RNA-binding Zn-ribbon protein involved in translation (DUF1610 family)